MIEKEELDNKVDLFLDLLERDIKENKEHCKNIDSNLVLYVCSLFSNELIDVNAAIIDEE